MPARPVPGARGAWVLAFCALSLIVPCLRHWTSRADPTREVVVYTSVDQVCSEAVFKDFERRTGIKVRAVFDTEETKSTGVLNRLIAEAAQPQADVFWSGDPVRPLLLVKKGLVERYLSPEAADIPTPFRAGDGTWTGCAARARILLVHRGRLGRNPPPRSIQDLADPRWKGLTAIANPIFGTTTMHAAALFAAWGPEKARDFFTRLKQNDVRIASSNGEVKRLVIQGEVAFGLADTDDAQEALAAEADVEVVYPDQDGMGTLVMPTAVVVIKGAPHAREARELVDDLVSAVVERHMVESAGYLPIRAGMPIRAGIHRAGDLKAVAVEYGRIAQEMETIQPWLREWVGF